MYNNHPLIQYYYLYEPHPTSEPNIIGDNMKTLAYLNAILLVSPQSFAFLLPSKTSNFHIRVSDDYSIETCKRSLQKEHVRLLSVRLQAKKKKKAKSNSPIICTNRQARRNYEVVSTYDAGISLLGSEIKAIRDGKMNLQDGFVRPDKTGKGMSLHNVHIGKHSTGEYFNHEERRVRPLLLKSEECRKLRREIDMKGMTIVPLKAFFNNNNLVKIQVGLCRGKNVRDKRNAIKDRELKRDTDRMMKSFRV